MTYDGRRLRQESDDPGERHEPGIDASAGVAHLARRLFLFAFAHVMHRAHLARSQSRTTLFFVNRRVPLLTAERQRRGDDAGDLAGEPEADDPRETLPDSGHGPDQGSTAFAGMIEEHA